MSAGFFEIFFFFSAQSQNENKKNMAKHHPDLIFCRKQPGIAIGRVCEKVFFFFFF